MHDVANRVAYSCRGFVNLRELQMKDMELVFICIFLVIFGWKNS